MNRLIELRRPCPFCAGAVTIEVMGETCFVFHRLPRPRTGRPFCALLDLALDSSARADALSEAWEKGGAK